MRQVPSARFSKRKARAPLSISEAPFSTNRHSDFRKCERARGSQFPVRKVFNAPRASQTSDLELRNRKPGVPFPVAPDAHGPRPNRFEANKKFYEAAASRAARSSLTAKSGVPIPETRFSATTARTRSTLEIHRLNSKIWRLLPQESRRELQNRAASNRRNWTHFPGAEISRSENSPPALKAGLRTPQGSQTAPGNFPSCESRCARPASQPP